MKLIIEKTDGTKLIFEGEVAEIERIAKELAPVQAQLVQYIPQPYPVVPYVPNINPVPYQTWPDIRPIVWGNSPNFTVGLAYANVNTNDCAQPSGVYASN